jgi:hypothetical protein
MLTVFLRERKFLWQVHPTCPSGADRFQRDPAVSDLEIAASLANADLHNSRRS